jgi:hypothetical protein
MEISGMRTAFANAIRVSTILDVDSDLRPKWQEMLDNLAASGSVGRGRRPAQPTGGDAGAPGGAAPTTSSAAPTTRPDANRPRPGRKSPLRLIRLRRPRRIPANEPDAPLKARFPRLQRAGQLHRRPGIGGAQIFRNRLRLREGPGAIDCEHIAGLATGIHSTLLNRHSMMASRSSKSSATAGREAGIAPSSFWPAADSLYRLRSKTDKSNSSRSLRRSVGLAASKIPGRARRSSCIEQREVRIQQ